MKYELKAPAENYEGDYWGINFVKGKGEAEELSEEALKWFNKYHFGIKINKVKKVINGNNV